MKKLLLPLFLLMLLPACAGGSAAIAIEVTGLDSFAFEPDPVTVPAGAEISVTFNNTGSLQHSWVVVANDVDPILATLDDALNGASSGDVAGGDSSTFTFTSPADPGNYKIVCTIPGHAAGGMIGTLTVTSE